MVEVNGSGKHSSLFHTAKITAVKCFIVQAPGGPNARYIKIFENLKKTLWDHFQT
jgi:hypothetical protein